MAGTEDYSSTTDHDRMKELKAFDDSSAGVKGLVDAGIQSIPNFFKRPPEDLAEELKSSCQGNIQVPVIDLSGIQEGSRRREIIDAVRLALENWGFFQLVNHGIPVSVLNEMIDGIRAFHEQDLEAKKKFYTRDSMKKVRFDSNYDLYTSRFANWRDTLTMPASDDVDPEELPSCCRNSTLEYTKQIKQLGETLYELMSEALGLKSDHLKSLGCVEGRTLVCHYYPACPEPDLTLGCSKHADPGILTLLLQNQVSGLQVLRNDQRVNIDPIQGGLIVNVGDLLQIISNDKLKSVEHRVIASHVGPRISVAFFFTGSRSRLYGPIRDLTSEDEPPRYREVGLMDYMRRFFSKPLYENNLDYYKI